MKSEIARLDLQRRLDQPEFPNREACAILGVTNDVLQIWNRRGLIPSAKLADGPGRGAGRKYSEAELIYLMLVKLLIKHVGQVQCAAIAATSVPIIVGQAWMMLFSETDEDLPQTDGGVFLAIYQRDGGFGADVLAANGAPGFSRRLGSVEDWLRSTGHDDVIILNAFSIARRLYGRIAAARADRAKK